MRSPLALSFFAFVIIYLLFNTPIAFLFLTGKPYHNNTTLLYLFFFMGYSFLLFFALPALVNRCIYKEKIIPLGLNIPENKTSAVLLILLAELMLIPAILILAKQSAFKHYYSMAGVSQGKLALMLLVVFPFYYFCEEFFFRGFLLVTLWRKVRWHSFWIVDILFVFAHFFKPFMEIVLAFPAGIIFAFLALRTRSIYPSMIVHYSMGIAMILSQR